MTTHTESSQAQKRYWIARLGASFVVYSPDGEIVAFRPDLQSAEKARDFLNSKAEGGAQ